MADDPHSGVLDACYKMLVPIARMLLVNGISYREFDDTCRRAFVSTASEEFGVRGRATNVARVATMTGIARKEVRRIRSDSSSEDVDSRNVLSPLADLLYVWATNTEYTDDDGNPLELECREGTERSFNELVRLCMGDVTPGAVKKELLRLGAIGSLPDDRVRLLRRALIPLEIFKRLESAIVYSLRGLAETVAHNNDPRKEDQPRRFERFVESIPLSDEDIDKIRELLIGRMTEITEEFDAVLNEGFATEYENSGRRIGIGLFFSE